MVDPEEFHAETEFHVLGTPGEDGVFDTEERLALFQAFLSEKRNATGWKPQLQTLLTGFRKFLTDRPAPPREWVERTTQHGGTFEYHQLLLPPDYVDPYQDDLGNLTVLADKLADSSFMALEHFLITRNRFLWIDGHMPGIEAPEPLLMLDSDPEGTDESEEDCYLWLFPDGSWAAYNLDGNEEEGLGDDWDEVVPQALPRIATLHFRRAVNGADYGIMLAPPAD